MKITQLKFNRESIFDYALRDNVYVVSIQRGRSTIPRPFGLAFKSVKNFSLIEMTKALETGELALVEVIF